METRKQKTEDVKQFACYHCGETCERGSIVSSDQKVFCCDGCMLVYDLLKDNSLCTYYALNSNPGNTGGPSKNGKYDYLDDESVSSKLICFRDGDAVHVNFYIPKIHCSSCIWLLENLHKLNKNVQSSVVNFVKKEVKIVFDISKVKLSEIVALCSNIGYEPLINLNSLDSKPVKASSKSKVLKIGLAGFCFGNIMMLSFPDYFSFGNFFDRKDLSNYFNYLNLVLSLPVILYCASDFFVSAAKTIRHRYLNIDAPIALAILVTFIRSVYEILTGTGTGYLDSMSGIVFFMLIGRYFQDRTYEALSFDHDYRSYFPIGVTVLRNNKEENLSVESLKKGDKILIRNAEIIPCDSILQSDMTHIDYSFITGESRAIKKQKGDRIYAGGKQLGAAITLEVDNPISKSYLTQLWNDSNGKKKEADSIVDKLNKYFTIAVLIISFGSLLFWSFFDITKGLNAMTAVLIVACPCGLLLTASFTNGNILRLLGRNKFYLKNSSVIEAMADADMIVFDKTGTLTQGIAVDFVGITLSDHDMSLITSLAAQSSHPLSRKIYEMYPSKEKNEVLKYEEVSGHGIKGYVNGKFIIIGSKQFVIGSSDAEDGLTNKTFVMMDGKVVGFFNFTNSYRKGLGDLLNVLDKKYILKLLSGDSSHEKNKIEKLFGTNAELFFDHKPDDKMNKILEARRHGHKVIMIGDGLNDAGALLHSNVGIAVSEDTNNFSPACDAILDSSSFDRLPDFLKFAKAGKAVIKTTFGISLIYNIIGLTFAVQGVLSPVIAAILMPVSSVSIVLLATLSTTIISRKYKL